MAGGVHVDEVERALGIDLPRGDYETVAGLLIAAHGGLMDEGTSLQIELPADPADLAAEEPPAPRVLQVQVLAVERHVPARVRLELPDAVALAAGSDAPAAGVARSAGAGAAGTAGPAAAARPVEEASR